MYAFLPTSNQEKGRRGYKPEAVVIHITDGSETSVINTFTNPANQVSAHYLVSKTGKITQFVKEEDTAWHAGKVQNPSWKLLKPGVNPNFYTIGIEFEGFDNEKPTLIQAIIGAWLISMITKRWGIPIVQDRIVPHKAIYAGKICPGSGINTDALAWLANLL